MKTIFNKGVRTIKFKAGSISPQQNLGVEDEVAELLLKLYENEIIVAGAADDALVAENARLKEELKAAKAGKKEKVEEVAEVVTEEVSEKPVEKTLAELKAIATEKGIDFPAGISKPKLLELIG